LQGFKTQQREGWSVASRKNETGLQSDSISEDYKRRACPSQIADWKKDAPPSRDRSPATAQPFLWFLSLESAKKGTRLPAGTGELERFLPFAFFNLEAKPAGRVPPDAFLFVQAATKRKQKVPCHCVEHFCRKVPEKFNNRWDERQRR